MQSEKASQMDTSNDLQQNSSNKQNSNSRIELTPSNKASFRLVRILTFILLILISFNFYYFLSSTKQHLEITSLKKQIKSLKTIAQKYKECLGGKYWTHEDAPLRNLNEKTQVDYTDLYCAKGRSAHTNINRSEQKVLIDIVYGYKIWADPAGTNNLVTQQMANRGTFDGNIVSAIGRFARPGYKILNFGAQFGMEAVMLGKIIGPEGKLFLLQPYSKSYQILVKNVQLNNLSGIAKTYNVAASDRAGRGKIKVMRGNTGGALIFPESYGEITQQIQIVKLDDFLPKQIRFDFALIDVQRHEVQALLGMRQIIKRSPYLVIQVQWGWVERPYNRKNKQLAQQLFDFLKSLKYKFYLIKNFNSNACSIGNFEQVTDLNKLLNIGVVDLLIAPDTVILPQS